MAARVILNDNLDGNLTHSSAINNDGKILKIIAQMVILSRRGNEKVCKTKYVLLTQK
jgi:hypothetical protein